MNFIQRGKQYFLGREYQKALKIFQDHRSQITEDKLPIGLDLAACSSFMMCSYDAANEYISQAILLNPKILDFYINKAAILRCLGHEDEAIQLLAQTQQKVKDPAIYFNLKQLSRQNQEIVSQIYKISEYEQLNKNYDKWNGIVPTFLKNYTTLSDYIFKCEEQTIKYFLMPFQKQINVVQIFKNYTSKIQMRELQQLNYGIDLQAKNKKLFELFKDFLLIYTDISKIKIKIEKKELIDQLIQILKLMKEDPLKITQIKEIHVKKLIEHIKIKSEKQIAIYRNLSEFQQAKKQVLSSYNFKLKDCLQYQSVIQIAVTEKHFLIYLNNQFKRYLTPKRSMKQIIKLPKEIQKEVFNFYWFICLRIAFCSDNGIDIDQYLKCRRALSFIYYQIQQEDELKFDKDQQFIEKTILIFQKYNKLFSSNLIAEQIKTKIVENCKQYKNYLSEVDHIYLSFLKNQEYVKNLFSSQNQQKNLQQKSFRQNYNLNNSLEDRIAQNLMILFYHFRNADKKHQILLKSFTEVAVQTKNTLNGKQSFYKNYYETIKTKQTFMQKIWKKIVD